MNQITWDEILSNRVCSNPGTLIPLPEFIDPWRNFGKPQWGSHQAMYCWQHGHGPDCSCKFKHGIGAGPFVGTTGVKMSASEVADGGSASKIKQEGGEFS